MKEVVGQANEEAGPVVSPKHKKALRRVAQGFFSG